MSGRQELVRQLNRLNDEVFSLYYSGFYDESLAEARHLQAIARDKLGRQHPSVMAISENIEFMRSNPVAPRKVRLNREEYQHKKERIFQIKREIVETETALELSGDGPVQDRMPGIPAIIAGILALVIVGVGVWQYVAQSALDGQGVTVHSKSMHPRPINASAVFSMAPRDQALLEVPTVCQYPELPRGCEVSSLAMMLHYAGFNVDKMTLANQVRKDTTSMQMINGQIYFGNPQRGFVGDMYTLRNPGLGVYAEPIADLARQYLGKRVADLSGRTIDDLYLFVNNGLPVWIVTNTDFKPEPVGAFSTWMTADGPIRITYKQHAVLITGYDSTNVYVNDPRGTSSNYRVDRKEFEAAWVQMGRQAVSYLPEGLSADEFLK